MTEAPHLLMKVMDLRLRYYADMRKALDEAGVQHQGTVLLDDLVEVACHHAIPILLRAEGEDQ